MQAGGDVAGRLHEADLLGPQQRLGPAARPELGADVRRMPLGGGERNDELARDGGIARAPAMSRSTSSSRAVSASSGCPCSSCHSDGPARRGAPNVAPGTAANAAMTSSTNAGATRRTAGRRWAIGRPSSITRRTYPSGAARRIAPSSARWAWVRTPDASASTASRTPTEMRSADVVGGRGCRSRGIEEPPSFRPPALGQPNPRQREVTCQPGKAGPPCPMPPARADLVRPSRRGSQVALQQVQPRLDLVQRPVDAREPGRTRIAAHRPDRLERRLG